MYLRYRVAKLIAAMDRHWPTIRLALLIPVVFYAVLIIVGQITHAGDRPAARHQEKVIWLDGGRIALLRVPEYLQGADADSAIRDGRFNQWLAECRHSGFEWTGSFGTDRHGYIPFKRIDRFAQ